MCFERKETIFTLSGEPLNLVNQFTYLGSNISSTESDIKMRQGKPWTTID